MPKVILICGKICSGKTWYARSLQAKHPAVILSTDEVTYDLTGNEQGEGYDAFAARVNRYLRKKAAEIVLAGADVILDWGFWTKAERAESTAFFRSRGIAVEWHCVAVSDVQWERNIVERNRRIMNGDGGPDFLVDEGLKQKVLSCFEMPAREEMDVWAEPGHRLP